MSKAAAAIIQEAADLVGGARAHTHGDCVKQHKALAELWSTYIRVKYGFAHDLTSEDVAWMLVDLKRSRTLFGLNRDNFVDAAGYCGIAGVCAEEERGT